MMFKDVAILCCLCESNGWSVDHFLLNFLVVRDIWFFEFSISSECILCDPIQMLTCWQCRFDWRKILKLRRLYLYLKF